MKIFIRLLGLLVFLCGLFFNYLDWYLLQTSTITDTYFYFLIKVMVLVQVPYPYIFALFIWVAPTLMGIVLMIFPLDISWREVVEVNQNRKLLERR